MSRGKKSPSLIRNIPPDWEHDNKIVIIGGKGGYILVSKEILRDLDF